MNAVVAVESRVVDEGRIARLESDVREIKGDVKTLQADMGSLRADIGKNKADTEKEFAGVRVEIEKTRTEMEKGFGLLAKSIESAKLWMLVTGVGSVIVVTFVTLVGRVLKIF